MNRPDEMIEIALRYSSELDECTRTGGANIDALMELLTYDVTRIVDGQVTESGADEVRQSFLRRASRLSQDVAITGIDVWGSLVVCRILRQDTTMIQGNEHHLRILLISEGKVARITVVTDPAEDRRVRQDSSAARN